MIPQQLKTDTEALMYGAAGVAAIIALFAMGLDLLGVELFIGSTFTERAIELLLGWALLWAVIWPAGTFLQILSYYTPLPPVVERRDRS